MQEINLTIDGKNITVPSGITILEAAKLNGIDIPTLCFLKDVNKAGDCRICIVEVDGAKGYQTACTTNVVQGMKVRTNTKEILETRKTILDLIISNHNMDCLTCIRSQNCELQDLAKKFSIDKIVYEGEKKKQEIDDLSPSIKRDMSKCILCRRCIAACNKVQEIRAIEVVNRGFESKVSTVFENSIANVNCVNCGQCIKSCPVGALMEVDTCDEVIQKINDENTVVIFQTAPAVRTSLGEELGYDIGTDVTGKMISAIKQLGADYVFDTNTGADFTIVEEANEFVDRFLENKNLPMITSCCPSWVKFAETNYPDQLSHLSSCKSPHQMFGALLKKYYSKILNINEKEIYVVSVMPCVAKKYECKRSEMENDVDNVITTRELARMIKKHNIDFKNLKDQTYDEPFGVATGAGAIFGSSGGVMESALRYAYEIMTSEKLDNVEFTQLRHDKQIKELNVKIDDQTIRTCVVSGLKNARKIMDQIKDGKSEYDFIEIMACPGGCINGAGQAIVPSKKYLDTDVRKKRANILYNIDQKSQIRKSQDNPSVIKVYDQILGKPGSYLAKEILHTKYTKKDKYNLD